MVLLYPHFRTNDCIQNELEICLTPATSSIKDASRETSRAPFEAWPLTCVPDSAGRLPDLPESHFLHLQSEAEVFVCWGLEIQQTMLWVEPLSLCLPRGGCSVMCLSSQQPSSPSPASQPKARTLMHSATMRQLWSAQLIWAVLLL